MSETTRANITVHPFELTGSGSLPIRGDVREVRGATQGVVLLHGFTGCFRAPFFPMLADALAGAGLNVVSFNVAHGFTDASAELRQALARTVSFVSTTLETP
jgi:predicted alpha/beta-fold hydrolase